MWSDRGWRRGAWRGWKFREEERDASPGGCAVVVLLWPWKGGFGSCALAVCCHHFPCASTAWWHACLRPLNQGTINSATKLWAVFSRDFSLPSSQWSGKRLCWSKKVTKNAPQVVVAGEGQNVPYFSRERVRELHPWQIVSATLQGCVWNDWPESCKVCRRTETSDHVFQVLGCGLSLSICELFHFFWSRVLISGFLLSNPKCDGYRF